MAVPAEPVNPVSQASRSAFFGTYSDLVFVRARHHEAGVAAALEFSPELGDLLGALRGGGRVVEALKAGHGTQGSLRGGAR